MTVLFDIRDYPWPADADGDRCPPPSMYLELSEANARDFLMWLGLDGASLWGEMPARELIPLLRRRLWPENRSRGDHGRQAFIVRSDRGSTIVECGREAGRLAEYAERLLALAEHAGDRTIIWS